MQKNKKIVVIGAGITGLAAAALLGKDGYDVTVLEKNSTIGGRGRQYNEKGFSFDMGPSWYMMPEVFDHFFSLFGKKPGDFYELKRLDAHYKVFFDDASSYTIFRDNKRILQLFEKLEPGAGYRLKAYLKKARWIYNAAMGEMVYYDYENLLQLLNPRTLGRILGFNMFRTFHQNVAKYFHSPKIQKIIEFTTVFLGGSPYNTPAFYSLITHTDYNLGIWYPMGGIFSFIRALESLCKTNNVTLLTNTPVTKFTISKNLITQVHSGKNVIPVNAVLNSADYRFTETSLLPAQYQTYPSSYWDSRTMSPSAFCIYLGVTGNLKNVEHHNLYFDSSWENHFKTVYTKKTWPKKPSYYVHIPSLTDPSLAPKNSHSVFILVPVAADLKDADPIRKPFAEKIIQHFEKITGNNLTGRVIVKKIFSHENFIKDYNAYKGAAFGIAHTFSQSAFFRPRNRSKKLGNLFYTGQYTNPGVGMPTGLISSQIARNLIKRYV